MASVEFFEQAERAVARRGARVWAHEPGGGWHEAPHLAPLLPSLVLPLEPEAFARHFPEAARTALPSTPSPRPRLFRFMSQH